MRPIHLWIAVLALAIAVFGLWRFVAGGPPAQALAAGLSTAGAERGAVPAELGRAEAAAERDAAGASSAAREVAVEPGRAGPSPAAAAADERLDVVTGRVLDGYGQPVAGAAVHASARQRYVRLPLDIEPDGLAPSWYAVVSATTGTDGRYELEGLSADELALVVRAPGFAPSRREGMRVRERDGRRELDDALLTPGAVCAGRVVDPKGQGIAGVRIVQAVDGRGGTGSVVLSGRGIPLGESAADGSFRVDELTPGPFSLSFDGAGFRIAEREGSAALETPLSGWIVALDYGAAIAGRVDSVQGAEPFPAERLAALRVSARAARERGAPSGGPQSDGPAGDARARHGAFDGEGGFAIEGLVPGAPYRLTVWEPHLDADGAFESWSRLDAFQPTSARGGDRGVLLEHRPQSGLVFRVLDDATGEPLEEFGVWVGVGRKQRLLDDQRKPLERHPGGRVVCSDLRLRPGGSGVSLAVVAPGRESFARDDLRVAPGETRDLGDVRLVRAPELIVTVLAEESGTPLEGARVGISYMSERELDQASFKAWLSNGDALTHFSPDVLLARSDAAGRASLGARAGQSGLLFATAKGRLACDPVRVAMPSAGELEQQLSLRRGGTVVVRVRDDAGDPVEGVAVAHRAPDTGGEQRAKQRMGGEEQSDAAGELRFEALAAGVHGFRLSDQPSTSAFLFDDEDEQEGAGPSWTEVVVAGPGEVAVDLVAPPRGTLEGTVRESGVPLEGASLQLVLRTTDGAGPADLMSVGGIDDPLTSASDRAGAFLFEDIAAGAYDLFVAHPLRRMPHKLEVEVRKGVARVDVELSLTQVEGRVVDVDGRPLEGIDVSISGADLPRYYTPLQMVVAEDDRGSLQMRYDQRASRSERSDAQGRYTLRGVAAGTPLTVVASGEMVVVQHVGPFDLAEGELRRGVDFRLEAAGAIALELRGEPSASSQNWFRVELRRASEEDAQRSQASSTVLSAWQRKRLVGSLQPGRWTVQLKDGGRPDEVLQSFELEVSAGGRHELVFRL